jgi:hypothetical protein
MSSANRAIPIQKWLTDTVAEACGGTAVPRPLKETPRTPVLRLTPLLCPTQPRRFARVPTHAVGAHPEQREYPRATLKLPLRLRSVGGVAEKHPVTLVTRDISSTGVYFLSPKALATGTPVELEVILVSKPLGLGNVVLVSMARVRRTEPAAMPGWFGVAAAFDDVEFDRDDGLPSRFQRL